MNQSLDEEFLDGRFLVAMPGMEDGRFAHAVVYVCAHSEEGAMGIVLNQSASNITFADLLTQLEIIDDVDAIRLPSPADKMLVHRGGPVESGRGFVLHSDDFFIDSSTLPIGDGICLTATLEILKAIAEGRGPDQAMLALGYAGWGAGQLETEIQANGWIIGPADPSIIFDQDNETKWQRALALMGIDAGMLSSEAGHA
ncbi:YqgE/AlgH family protein [Rhizobiales bacterium]|uniref:YqgE/AlgH family protein n=1 Tax=Hongsoonwoonella zoysiae TaxID=2821844 RepID=UPI00155F6F2B|nr:YqgE/AlgH family protein [Hongsoonwoonella zoysiae]NRG19791.1 YqgE/AlgH family protein [Hongsoonwoonella zoysiae]